MSRIQILISDLRPFHLSGNMTIKETNIAFLKLSKLPREW